MDHLRTPFSCERIIRSKQLADTAGFFFSCLFSYFGAGGNAIAAVKPGEAYGPFPIQS